MTFSRFANDRKFEFNRLVFALSETYANEQVLNQNTHAHNVLSR